VAGESAVSACAALTFTLLRTMFGAPIGVVYILFNCCVYAITSRLDAVRSIS
jgi:hypothetical protein